MVQTNIALCRGQSRQFRTQENLVTNTFKTTAISAALALLISAPAASAAGMNFDIENSSDYIITGFYTGEDGQCVQP
jgi:uncharacterized membrane protein